MTYKNLITSQRPRQSTIKNRTLSTETDSDHGRVLFSTAFRRLQQKTQVFPLEDNAAVRSRLTHSLEVAYLGRLIALRIIEKSSEPTARHKPDLTGLEIPFRNIVETACLIHDIGNPPFGHFGEYATREWFRKNGLNLFKQSNTPRKTRKRNNNKEPAHLKKDLKKGNRSRFSYEVSSSRQD
jgi:dGTPase